MRAHRSDVFAVPLWTADLDEFGDDLAEMAHVARDVLHRHPTDADDPHDQSRAVLQEEHHPAWQRYFEVLSGIMEEIVSRDLPPRYTFSSAFLRSWVLEISDVDAWRQSSSTLVALHSHLPAVLSSVFYLEVPEVLIGATSGGTTFKDPNSVLTSAYATPSVHVSPAPGRLVIFPSWLEHLPEPPAPGLAVTSPRLVVSTDLRIAVS